MSDDRPERDSMTIEEATISDMSEITAIVEVLERKGRQSSTQPIRRETWRITPCGGIRTCRRQSGL
jgi:hypothetical protein